MFTNKIVVPILGDETRIRRNSLRRLFTEADTLAAGDLSRCCDPAAAEVKAKRPPGEREQRRPNLSDRLQGSMIHGEHEPSMTLINNVHEMYEENALLPPLWIDLTKRETELRGAKTENVWKVDGKLLKDHVARCRHEHGIPPQVCLEPLPLTCEQL